MNLYMFAENVGLLSEEDCSWVEDKVPLGHRGVKVSWLYNFARQVGKHIEDEWIQHDYEQRASIRYDYVPTSKAPQFRRYPVLNPKFLVPNIVEPLTRNLKCPLYARVPLMQRGKPDVFVSHTWSQPLIGDGEFCTLETIPKKAIDDDPCIWIDIVAYNQHRSFETIASDMKNVIQSIGQLCLPLIDAAPFSRLWCLWEILCAHTTGAEITISEAIWSVHDLGRIFRIFSEEFHSVSDASTTKQKDKEDILNAMISTFGSLRQTNEYLYKLLQNSLTHEEDKPWLKNKS